MLGSNHEIYLRFLIKTRVLKDAIFLYNGNKVKLNIGSFSL
jgi:hypothetical protein